MAPRLKRALVAASVVAAAGVLPMVSAAPASAAPSTCVNYIASKGYLVGPKVRAACQNTRVLGKSPNPYCLVGLSKIGVKWDDAVAACNRA
ncbi:MULTISPECIES: hypothetical protein [unclassified Streptomyces]|uniref:hypothetical protein n=1 Tax=unclassified Streptomyces TaxID=2593676 RepID=UPI003D73C8C3